MLSESKFHELYRRQQESGLTIKEFCTNEGIAPSSFYYWKKKLKKNHNTRADFIPLVIKSTQSYSGKDHSPVQETRELSGLSGEMRWGRDFDLTFQNGFNRFFTVYFT